MTNEEVLRTRIKIFEVGLDRIIASIRMCIASILQYEFHQDVIEELEELDRLAGQLRRKQLRATVIDPEIDFSELEDND